MGQTAEQKTYYTREEYLTFEDKADYKSCYYDGEILAMAGGSRNHSVICFNLIRRIGEAIDDKNCVGFDSNMKLDISRHNLFLYPDVMVVCGDIEFRNPVLIVEVLSPGTEDFDREDKFAYYQTLPSLREYVLISQDKPMVETYCKQDGKNWLHTVSKGYEASVIFQTLGYEFSLEDIYRKVDWKHKRVKAIRVKRV